MFTLEPETITQKILSNTVIYRLVGTELNNPKNLNFEKLKKKTPGDIIILHMCTMNDNQMMYGS